MSIKLTDKQQFVLSYLKKQNDFISPGIIGGEIWNEFKIGSGHSSTGSPICKALVNLGLAERNKKGHYKAID